MDFTEGIKALVTGLSTVFLVLILISIIISLLKHVKFVNKKKAIQAPSNVEEVKNTSNNEKVVSQTDDLELVAVITAAIAASLNTSVDQLKVTSFRRISGSKGWNAR